MEALEYNLNDNPIVYSDNKKIIFLSISILSWLTFLVTSWISIGLPHSMNMFKIIGLTLSINFEKDSAGPYQYYPIMILYEFHYAIFIFAFSLATISFIIYILFKENENVMELMLGKFSRFHFIPLFCISGLFLLGESINIIDEDNIREIHGRLYPMEPSFINYPKKFNQLVFEKLFHSIKEIKFIFNFAFTIIALASLIFICIKTKVKSPWYAFVSINKGAYSCLIPLLVYNLFFSILFYVKVKLIKKNKTSKDWTKASGIAFSLIVGIVNSLLSFILKDIMISFMNILIYAGMLVYFFKIKKKERDNYNGFADGIIDIIILTGSVGIIIFLSFKWKKIYKQE